MTLDERIAQLLGLKDLQIARLQCRIEELEAQLHKPEAKPAPLVKPVPA